VLLEISQLLTTVASPVAAIEDQHGNVLELVWYTERDAVHGTRLKPRETFPDTKSFHIDTPEYRIAGVTWLARC
jgi:hypothetical protein